MKRKKRSKIGLYVMYGALTVFILLAILSFNDISEIFSVLSTADIRYVLLALLLLCVYVALYPLTLALLARRRGTAASFGTAYMIGMTEHFFNGITPLSTGGQPFQAYAFSKARVKVSESTSLLLMNFIIFMIVTNGFALVSLIYAPRFVTDVPMAIIAVIGFAMNFIVLAFTVALAVSRRVRALLCRLLDFLASRRLIGKFLAPRVESIKEYFEQVQSAFKQLISSKRTFIECLILKTLAMAAYYSVTFFIMRALGVDVAYSDFFFVMSGTSFAITMVVFFPTPGASGGIEFAFNTVFANIAGTEISAVSYGGMLMWRLLTYYLVMLISVAFYVWLEAVTFRRIEAKSLSEDV